MEKEYAKNLRKLENKYAIMNNSEGNGKADEQRVIMQAFRYLFHFIILVNLIKICKVYYD